jgi:cytochrome c-type biogenesis protein CcmH/NrfG
MVPSPQPRRLIPLLLLATVGAGFPARGGTTPRDAAPPDSAEILYRRGEDEAVLRLVPSDEGASRNRLLMRGWSLYRMDRMSEARTAFEAGIARDPGDPEMRLGLAYVLYRTGENTRAERIFQSLLRREPRRREVRYGAALACFAAERYEEALPLLDGLLAGDGASDAGLADLLERCVDGYLQGRRRREGEDFSPVLEAWALERRGLSRASTEAFRWTLRRDPFHPGARLGLGMVGPRAGAVREAREALEGLLVESPDHEEARLALARLELSQGRPGRAADLLGRVLELDPENDSARRLLERATASPEGGER